MYSPRHFSGISNSKRTAKNRRIVNSYLRRMHHLVGKDLSLNERGICFVQYKKFIISLEIPDHDADCFLVSSMVFRLKKGDNHFAVMEQAMELNYRQQDTRGASLGLQGDEISLMFSAMIATLTRDHLVNYLEDFMHTAVDVNAALEKHRNNQVPQKHA